jgi:hypothetical protein
MPSDIQNFRFIQQKITDQETVRDLPSPFVVMHPQMLSAADPAGRV